MAADMVSPKVAVSNTRRFSVRQSGIGRRQQQSLVSAIKDALSGAGTGGDIDPVYLGNSMIDEIIVSAQQRLNLRSGGR